MKKPTRRAWKILAIVIGVWLLVPCALWGIAILGTIYPGVGLAIGDFLNRPHDYPITRIATVGPRRDTVALVREAPHQEAFLADQGISKPLLVGSQAYFYDATCHVNAMDIQTRQIIWKQSAECYDENPPTATPASLVFQESSFLYARDWTTGEMLWKNRISGSTAIFGSVIVVASDFALDGYGGPTLSAFDARDGSVIWSHSAPAVTNVFLDELGLVAISGPVITEYDPVSGNQMRTIHVPNAEPPNQFGYSSQTAALINSRLVFTVVHEVVAIDRATFAILWRRSGDSYYPLKAIASPGTFDSGKIKKIGASLFYQYSYRDWRAIDPADGSVLWTVQDAAGPNACGVWICTYDMSSESKTVTAVDPLTGEGRWWIGLHGESHGFNWVVSSDCAILMGVRGDLYEIDDTCAAA